MRREIRASSKRAFTLIEVLVATFILLVMVLILSKVFHQANVAWSAGFRRADGNMTGRSAVGFMARELMNVCADTNIFVNPIFDLHTLQFVTLAGATNQNGGRMARRITYQKNAGQDYITRIEEWPDPSNYGVWQAPPPWYKSEWCLVTNVQDITYSYPDNWPDYNDPARKIPEWIRITLTINRQDDVSGVGAASAGPDGQFGNDDDVDSW